MKEEVGKTEMSGEHKGRGRSDSGGCYLRPRCVSDTQDSKGKEKQRHSSVVLGLNNRHDLLVFTLFIFTLSGVPCNQTWTHRDPGAKEQCGMCAATGLSQKESTNYQSEWSVQLCLCLLQ